MTLSAFLVKSILTEVLYTMSFDEVVDASRKWTRTWWEENPDVSGLAERNFQMLTGLRFADHADAIINGFADHYAEKIFASGHKVDELIAILKKIRLEDKDRETLARVLKSNTALCMTSHFGGVDLLPVFLSYSGFPASVFLRFKSDIARNTAYDQLKRLQEWLDFQLLDADGNLMREIQKMRKKPRILVTVADSFKNWRRDRLDDRQEIDFLGHRIGLDNTPDKLAELFRSPVYFVIMHRDKPGEYHVSLEPIEPDENGYRYPIFCKWRELITSKPDLWYAWEELHWTWTLDPYSPDTEIGPPAK